MLYNHALAEHYTVKERENITARKNSPDRQS